MAVKIKCLIDGRRVEAEVVQQYPDGDVRVRYQGVQYMVRKEQLL